MWRPCGGRITPRVPTQVQMYHSMSEHTASIITSQIPANGAGSWKFEAGQACPESPAACFFDSQVNRGRREGKDTSTGQEYATGRRNCAHRGDDFHSGALQPCPWLLTGGWLRGLEDRRGSTKRRRSSGAGQSMSRRQRPADVSKFYRDKLLVPLPNISSQWRKCSSL